MRTRALLVPAVAAGLISGVGASLLIATMSANRRERTPSESSPPPVVHVDHLAEHRRAIQRHNAEQLDQAWSQPTARSLTSSLSKLGKASGFRVASVDCRTTSCVAYLDWTSHETAVTHFADVLHQDLDVQCGRETVVPRPHDPAGPYPAQVVYQCARPDLANTPGAGRSVGEQSAEIQRQIASD